MRKLFIDKQGNLTQMGIQKKKLNRAKNKLARKARRKNRA